MDLYLSIVFLFAVAVASNHIYRRGILWGEKDVKIETRNVAPALASSKLTTNGRVVRSGAYVTQTKSTPTQFS